MELLLLKRDIKGAIWSFYIGEKISKNLFKIIILIKRYNKE